jgi:peroxiredoxin
MALTKSLEAELGRPCPEFSLPSTQGGQVSSFDLISTQQPFLIVFMCNHCPYVKAIEDRLETLAKDLKALGMSMVGISANDASRYPEDSFENMKLKNYSFPYLYDESQKVARDFGAVCTPDFFGFDSKGKLAYRGRLDDNWQNPEQVTRRELFEAMKLLKKGETIPWKQMPSMGCSIKWK